MSLRTSANRYAKALFDVALQENNDLAQVDRDLDAVVEMMKSSPDLALASGLSAVTDAQRQAMMESVAAAMSLTTPVAKMMVLLAKTGKLNLLPDMAASFR